MTVNLVDRLGRDGTDRSGLGHGGQRPSAGVSIPTWLDSSPLLDCPAVRATVKRRRSLSDSLNVALQEFWTLAIDATDQHRAARHLPIKAPVTTLRAGGDAEAGSYETAINSAENLLQLLGQTHSVHWNLPIPVLARLIVATLNGLMVDYLHSGELDDARRILHIFSYQFSQWGRRNHKNDPSGACLKSFDGGL